jgi:hypothetical protein
LYVEVISDLSGVTVGPIDTVPGNAVLVYQDKRSITWQLDTTGGVPYTFAGFLLFDKLVSDSVDCVSREPIPASYSVAGVASSITSGRVVDSAGMCLDGNGDQVSCWRGNCVLLLGTAPPNITIVPFTPIPTIMPVPPTTMPFAAASLEPALPWPTPTMPVYPE